MANREEDAQQPWDLLAEREQLREFIEQVQENHHPLGLGGAASMFVDGLVGRAHQTLIGRPAGSRFLLATHGFSQGVAAHVAVKWKERLGSSRAVNDALIDGLLLDALVELGPQDHEAFVLLGKFAPEVLTSDLDDPMPARRFDPPNPRERIEQRVDKDGVAFDMRGYFDERLRLARPR